MATVQPARATPADEDKSGSATAYRFDPPHTDLPLLARIPDVSEVLAGATEAEESTQPQVEDEPVAETAETVPPAAEEMASAPPVTKPIAPEIEPIDAVERDSTPASHSRGRRPANRSAVQRALALPSKVSDGLFWSAVAGMLLLAGAMLWFNSDNGGEAKLPEGWESSQQITETPAAPATAESNWVEVKQPTADPTESNAPAAVAAEYPDSPQPAGPTLADPSVTNYQQADPPATTSREPFERETPPDAARPGMARLQGIIEKPDMRATNDRTESRLY